MGEYVQTDYLWEAIANLLEMAESLQVLHDTYFSG
jgi:hypothetical protein